MDKVDRTTTESPTLDWDTLCINPHDSEWQIGYEQGKMAAQQESYNNGYQVGQTTAISYGMEVGFIKGLLSVLEPLIETTMQRQQQSTATNASTDDTSTPVVIPNAIRAQKTLQSLRALVDQFPSPNDAFTNVSTKPQHLQADDAHTSAGQNEEIDNDDNQSPSSETQTLRHDLQRIRARFKLLCAQLRPLLPANFSLQQVLDQAQTEGDDLINDNSQHDDQNPSFSSSTNVDNQAKTKALAAAAEAEW